MTLKNKDGSLFTLNKPNPIMTEQEVWDKGKIVFHNKFGKQVVFSDEVNPPEKVEAIVNKSEPVIVEKVEEEEVDLIRGKVTVWCWPAKHREYKDDLYGEKYSKVVHGKKILVEAIIIDQGDLSIVIWVNTKAVTIDSILFPQTRDKRWWRVRNIEEQNSGYIVSAMISDFQPNFSD